MYSPAKSITVTDEFFDYLQIDIFK